MHSLPPCSAWTARAAALGPVQPLRVQKTPSFHPAAVRLREGEGVGRCHCVSVLVLEL